MSELDIIKQEISPILKKYPIISAGIFGSFALGEQTEKSDVDILIEVDPNSVFSLFDLVDVQDSLKYSLGREVDVCTKQSISKYIRNRVLSDIRQIYSI